MADVFTKKKRSDVMSRIRGKNTAIEIQVFKFLKNEGIPFRRHYKLPGNPDVVIPKQKRIIFVDGDFWHGWDLPKRKDRLPPFWVNKLGNNIKRDRRNRTKLKHSGWRILRVWEHELEKKPHKTYKKIRNFLTI